MVNWKSECNVRGCFDFLKLPASPADENYPYDPAKDMLSYPEETSRKKKTRQLSRASKKIFNFLSCATDADEKKKYLQLLTPACKRTKTQDFVLEQRSSRLLLRSAFDEKFLAKQWRVTSPRATEMVRLLRARLLETSGAEHCLPLHCTIMI
ncbi:hypothetical protein CBL_11034 [Carabus blaptoides fortunei]